MSEVCTSTGWAGAFGFSTLCVSIAAILIAFMWMAHREAMADKR